MKNTKSKTKKLIVWTALAIFAYNCNPTMKNPSRTTHLNFPSKLTFEIPYDVDTNLQGKLIEEGKFGEVQRLFEILSWQFSFNNLTLANYKHLDK